MSVAVIVPFTSGCAWRDRAWDAIRRMYETEHGWPIYVGQCPKPWSKGLALWDAVLQSDADVLVLADADSFVKPELLRETVEACENGAAWAMPHRRVHRLSVEATETYYAGGWDTQVHRGPYAGVIGGGITVVQREVYEDCPIDPRFYGWGGEDVSWGQAMWTLHGGVWRPQKKKNTRLWHLWHPPDNVGLIGSRESEALTETYSKAFNRPDRMRPIVEEGKCSLPTSSPTR